VDTKNTERAHHEIKRKKAAQVIEPPFYC